MTEHMKIYAFEELRGELYPTSFGERICESCFARPYEFSHGQYVLHYIVEGRGFFHKDGRDYTLSGGQVFLTRPGEMISFESDPEAPLRYIWIRFGGERARRLSELPDVTRIDGAPFLRMMRYDTKESSIVEYIDRKSVV